MQNNPTGPYDDVFANLAKIVEDIVKNMPESQHARIIGYTIITRQANGGDPEMFHAGMQDDDGEVPYEVVETDTDLFITAKLPADPKNAPIADIEISCVRIDRGREHNHYHAGSADRSHPQLLPDPPRSNGYIPKKD